MRRQIKLLGIRKEKEMGAFGTKNFQLFELSLSDRKKVESFLNSKFGFKIWNITADRIKSRTRKPGRTDEPIISWRCDHTIAWTGVQLSETLVCEPPSWSDEFPRIQKKNKIHITQVGLDSKMNRPLHKIAPCPNSHVENTGRTERKQSHKGDFGD